MKNRILALLGLSGAAVFCLPARGSITVGGRDNVQIGGFFSQGYLQSRGNNYPVQAEDGTFMFRELGFNTSTTLGSRIRVGAQAFAQRIGAYGEDKVILDWAVFDYNLCPELGVRAGRIKFPRGLYGEALDLDVVRPFVFLPLTQYSPVTRDFGASFDGAMLYGSLSLGRAGSLDYKAFYGDIPIRPAQGVSDFMLNTGVFKTTPGITDMGMDHTEGGAVEWGTPLAGLKLRFDYSYLGGVCAKGQFAFSPFPTEITSGIDRYAYTTYAAEYTRGSWSFAAEWLTIGGKVYTRMPNLPLQYRYAGAKSWYVSAARRFGPKWEVGGYLTRIADRFAAASTPTKNKQTDDYTLSVRHDVNEHLLFKIEWHHLLGEFNFLNTPRTPNPKALRKDTTDVFAAKTTLSF